MLGVMSRKAVSIELTAEEESTLRSRAVLSHASVSTVQRARVVLAASKGQTNDAIAKSLSMNRLSVALWRRRFAEERLAGLRDRPRSGRSTTYPDSDRVRVIEMACTRAAEAETQWSVRSLARATGVGRETVHRLLQHAAPGPNWVGTFSRSKADPDYAAERVHATSGSPRRCCSSPRQCWDQLVNAIPRHSNMDGR
jgi:transposase